MAVYALIHGAHHGAWCWDFLLPELQARGHEAVAVDLPVDDPSAGVSGYVDVTLEALEQVQDEVVAVGHSLGGLIAPVVATRRPVLHVVYLAAVVPEPGRAFAEQQDDEPEMVVEAHKIDNGDGTWTWPGEQAAPALYHDCSDERRRFALARLRSQSRAPHLELTPLTAMPDVPTTYLVCADDRALRPGWQRQVARRLGVQALEIPGSHTPFLARPAELADLLTTALRR